MAVKIFEAMAHIHQGFFKRGLYQYWHIKEDETLLINLPEKGRHYNGDSTIFFHPTDSPVFEHGGRIAISRKEFEEVKKKYLERVAKF